MPSVTASISIPATPERVWAVISDVGNAQRWNKAWSRIEMTTQLSEGRGTRFRAHVENEEGPDQAFEFEITEWVAPEYIVFTPVRDPEEEKYQITLDWHSFRIVQLDDANTRVELTAQATTRGLRGGFAGLILWPWHLFVWPGHQKRGLEAALSSLAELFGVPPRDDAS
ncbi:MAG: SRPBCC family protein [Chloroflexi bacterium]|nr:SRPBCC family protein [Chloroflexota bacterium]MCH7952582.1 SRPBCC family protein [Chloroflexota bacterium]MCI0783317.1 SRPBCC family protein [Chloroflexota bacterium]MCI0814194.1 SRPBCC family protein [Chloroflexota bacterium]MCI0816969.1 SRPBCC family protein [Chloroflexota bacterium]